MAILCANVLTFFGSTKHNLIPIWWSYEFVFLFILYFYMLIAQVEQVVEKNNTEKEVG